MSAVDRAVATRRCIVVASVLLVSVLAWTGGARASDLQPEAIITDGDGDVVSVVVERSKAPEAFEGAVTRRLGAGLRLEYIYRSHGTIAKSPNDPFYGDQWNLSAVRTPSAWTRTDGDGVIVAILDSGINLTGIDGICATIVSPYDAVEQIEGLAPLNVTASFGHGTHVAGTIAQCTNNGRGGAGIAPGVSIMPVRVLSDIGSGTSTQLADGIDWAVDNGADVINMSLGGDCGSTWPSCNDPLVDAAIARARAFGVVMVASSGNAALPFVAYPAGHPDVLAVGAVGKGDVVWKGSAGEGSNWGSALDLVAPGVEIAAETTNLGRYGYYLGTGTSMAVPHVSAAAAEILAVNPTLGAPEVAAILRSTALDLGPTGFDEMTGWGRLDIGASVDAAIATLPRNVGVDPCVDTPCDSLARVDASGLWGLWSGLTGTASVSSFYYGNPGDYPFMGDWDGDGVETPGLYRQSDGYVYLRNANTQGNADIQFFFGNPGDVPIAGDFNGDGFDTVSIYRPSNQTFYIINELGADDRGLGAAEFSYVFGNPGDKPFVGDFDGDGVETVGFYRESMGLVYFRNSLTTGTADVVFFYGDPGDQILAGDWDGDGDDTVAVYRPSTGRLYVNLENAQGAADWIGFVGFYPHITTAGMAG